jgi:hypothetical protein
MMAENPRTTTARDNDDSDIIDAAVAEAVPGMGGGGGSHNIGNDVATQTDLAQVFEPDANVRPQKADDIHNNQAYPHATPNDAGRTG